MRNINKLLGTIDLKISDAQCQAIDTFLKPVENPISLDRYNEKFEKIYVPVNEGEILVFHHKPQNPTAVRPIILIPGWGSDLDSFYELYINLIDKVECFHIETREKSSSRLTNKKIPMTVRQSAEDVQQVLSYLKFDGSKDFVLIGTCWGSSIILKGLIDRILPVNNTIVLFDPMHTLWFPKFLLNWFVPLVPNWLGEVIRPIGKWLALFGMKEQVQRKRNSEIIDNAEIWKWKRAAYQARDFELIGNLSSIANEVFILNGTKDKIHDQRFYPLIAQEIPNGRFVFLKTDESNRELLIGKVAREFAGTPGTDGLPLALQPFEMIF